MIRSDGGLESTGEAPEGERLVSLDILRALAYFAVLVIHAAMFATAARPGGAAAQGGLDRVVAELTDIFIRGKGISTFSMLFGIGFFILFERAARRGRSVGPLALRRLAALAVMGGLHYRFVWIGDVLLVYACLGLLLLPFLFTRPRTMLLAALGVFLLLSFVPNLAHEFGIDPRWSIEAWHHPEAVALGDKPLQGLFQTQVPVRLGRTIARMMHEAGSILPLFLLGAALWRSGWIADPTGNAPRLRRLFRTCLSLGLALSFLVHDPFGWVPAPWRSVDYGTGWSLLEDTAIFALALGYVSGLLLLLAEPRRLSRFALLAPMGRMALTNYLTHTLLLLAFMKALGALGLGLGATLSFLVALAIYAVQLAWSRAWLARFRFGPLEWIWRCVTYLRVEPLRRAV
ncbi:MAG TPA: DUF418 domain-containing protein [Holophagaceae bacterium]|nr:DUF418 domain-containing protein [Holophagaceae bacterium]